VASPQDEVDEGVTPPTSDEMLDKALNLLKAKAA
jgi:hypothetical protein